MYDTFVNYVCILYHKLASKCLLEYMDLLKQSLGPAGGKITVETSLSGHDVTMGYTSY